MKCPLFFVLSMLSLVLTAQTYDSFEIENGELIWRYTYDYQGPEDSLRSEIVSMIKSKLFTRHVQRTQVGNSGLGYTGEIEHYKVDCEAYGRKYQNTPLIYWKGEWKGKFVVEVRKDGYRVTIYGLYFEVRTQASTPHQKSNTRKGPYLKEVWKKGDPTFKSNVLDDITLMSISLRDAFDIKKYHSPVVDWQH